MKYIFSCFCLTLLIVLSSVLISCTGEPTIFVKALKPADFISTTVGDIKVLEFTGTTFDPANGSQISFTRDTTTIEIIGDTLFRRRRAIIQVTSYSDQLSFREYLVLEDKQVTIYYDSSDLTGFVLIAGPIKVGAKWKSNDADQTTIRDNIILDLRATLDLPVGKLSKLMHLLWQDNRDGVVISTGELYYGQEIGLIYSKFFLYSPAGLVTDELEWRLVDRTSRADMNQPNNLIRSIDLSKDQKISIDRKGIYGR